MTRRSEAAQRDHRYPHLVRSARLRLETSSSPTMTIRLCTPSRFGVWPLVIGVACLLAIGTAGCGDATSTDAASPEAAQASAPGRVLIIGIDGATPQIVEPMLAQGRLPNLAALAGAGAIGTIRSSKPIDSPRIWNTIVTGKVPEKHGIMHFAHPGKDGENTLYLSSDRKVSALWNIASSAGRSVGVVNFWNTFPPEKVNGVMVSDHLLARNIEGRRKIMKAGAVTPGPVVYPESWHARLRDAVASEERLTPYPNPLRDNDALPAYLVLVGDDLPRRFEEDDALARITRVIDAELRPDLLMLLLPGIDRASHFLWGSLEADQSIYAEELRLGDREMRGGRKALEDYYIFTDALIGVLVSDFDEDDLVLVLSDHGFEAGRGMGLLTGVHEGEAALDGVIVARGAGIAPGTRIEGFGIADVTPTVLAWMGIPPGEDMDGSVAKFIGARDVGRIATYDTTPIERMSLDASGAEQEIVDQLKRLGYLE